MRLSLLNLSLLNFSEKEEVERTFRIHANEDDDHLAQGRTVILIACFSICGPFGFAMPAFGMQIFWGRHELLNQGDILEKRGLCGISMKNVLE